MLGNQFKPAILQCFGDIAQAIGGAFETYLSVVAQVLQQAAGIPVTQETSFEMLDYIVSLREGIMDAWGGAVMALRQGNKSKANLQLCATKLILLQHNYYSHTSRAYSSFCKPSTKTRTVPKLSCGQAWVLLGAFRHVLVCVLLC